MVPGDLYSRAVLLLDFPHLTHVKIDLEHGFPQRHNGACPLLELSRRGERLASDIVDARRAGLRRSDDKILIEPSHRSDLPSGRVSGRKEDDLRPLFPEALPLPVPIDVEANLNSYRSKVRFEHRWILGPWANPSVKFALSGMNLAIPSDDSTLPVDHDGSIVRAVVFTDEDRADHVTVVLFGPL